MSTRRPRKRLLLLQPALPAGHPPEGRTGQLAGRPLDEPQVPGQRAELGEGARAVPPADGEGRQPLGVEAAGLRGAAGLVRQGLVGIDDVAGHRQVGVDRLPGDDQPHDLAGALEDPVDAHVAQRLFGGERALAPGGQRVGGLIAAAAADLHQVVDQPPALLGAVELGEGGLDPDVVAVLVGHQRGHVHDGFQSEGHARDGGDLLRDRLVGPDGVPHWMRPAPHSRATISDHFAVPAQIAGSDRRPVLRVVSAISQPPALLADQVLGRDVDVGEPGHAVLDAAQSHEGVAVQHLDARHRGLDDEGADAAAVTR